MQNNETIVYLVSCYPAVSHTFIQHEIAYLRKMGQSIAVASINSSNFEEKAKDEAIRKEEQNTFFIKKQGAAKAFLTATKFLCTKPINFFKGLLYSIKYTRQTRLSLKYLLGYFAEALLFANWFAHQNSRHVHVHFGNMAAVVAMIAQKLQPFTFSMSIHGPDIFFDETIEGLAMKANASEAIRCISFFAQSQIMRILPFEQWNKLSVIRIGVDPDNLLANKGAAIQHQHKKLVCVGRLVGCKGQALLLEALASLKNQGYKLQLTLIGDGPDKKNLTDICSQLDLAKDVHFTGALGHKDTILHVKNADIFVLASFAEGIPIVLMEAMALEIPCVTTCINGIPELIRDGKDGLLVPPSDLEGLINAIALLIDQPSVGQQLAKSGRERIVTNYNLEINTRALDGLFAKLHGGRQNEQHNSNIPDNLSHSSGIRGANTLSSDSAATRQQYTLLR